MIYGVKWPPLSDLRERFVDRHGPQEWLHPEIMEWPTAQPMQTEADTGNADQTDPKSEDLFAQARRVAEADLDRVRGMQGPS